MIDHFFIRACGGIEHICVHFLGSGREADEVGIETFDQRFLPCLRAGS